MDPVNKKSNSILPVIILLLFSLSALTFCGLEIHRMIHYPKVEFTVTDIVGGGYGDFGGQGACRTVKIKDSDNRTYTKEFTADTAMELPTYGDTVKLYVIDGEVIEPRSKKSLVGIGFIGILCLSLAICFIVSDIKKIIEKVKRQ